jgi:hypothetical protein
MTCCHWFNLTTNDDLLDLFFFSDEAWFHLSGYVNLQNMRIRSRENLQFFRESSLHYTFTQNWSVVIGPLFF